MATYFEVVTDEQKVVIDDAYARLRLLRIISVNEMKHLYGYNVGTYTDRANFERVDVYNIDLQENEYIVAVKPKFKNNNIVYVCDSFYENSHRTISIMIINMTSTSVVDTKNVLVYVYGTNSQSISCTYGLQLFDETGKETYNSNQRLLKVDKTFQNEYSVSASGGAYPDVELTIAKNGYSAVAVVNSFCWTASGGYSGIASNEGRPVGCHGIMWKEDGSVALKLVLGSILLVLGGASWAYYVPSFNAQNNLLLIDVSNVQNT